MPYSRKSLPYWHSFWPIIQGCLDIKFINVWQGSQKIFSTWFSGVESSLDFLPTSSVFVGNGYWWNPILSSKILYTAYSIVISVFYLYFVSDHISYPYLNFTCWSRACCSVENTAFLVKLWPLCWTWWKMKGGSRFAQNHNIWTI